jgi:hypothetical protein
MIREKQLIIEAKEKNLLIASAQKLSIIKIRHMLVKNHHERMICTVEK